MADLDWCKKRKGGIKIVEPNDNLSKEYLENAEETLKVLKGVEGKSNMWLAVFKYYFEYFCVYSILMKIGIKCEIHDCTIEVCRFLEKEKIIPFGFTEILEGDKDIRIDNQYYLKNRNVEINHDILRDFLLAIKEVLNNLNYDLIKEIRGKLE